LTGSGHGAVYQGHVPGPALVGRTAGALAILAAVGLTAWSLTERIPVYLHAYTVVIAFMAFTSSVGWVSSKPRFFLPAVLLALPLARLLAPLRTSVLVSLIAVLTAASTWFGMYLIIIAKWAP